MDLGRTGDYDGPVRVMTVVCVTAGCGLGGGPTIGFSEKGHSVGVEGGLSAIVLRGNVGVATRAGERTTYGTAALLIPVPVGELDGGYATASGALGYGRDARGTMFVGQVGGGGMYLHGHRDANGDYKLCRNNDACLTWSVTLSLSGHYRRGWQLWLDPRIDVLAIPDVPSTH